MLKPAHTCPNKLPNPPLSPLSIPVDLAGMVAAITFSRHTIHGRWVVSFYSIICSSLQWTQ